MSKEHMLIGGDSGPAITPGDASGSLLVRRVEEGQCPPRRLLLDYGVKIPPRIEIEKIRDWINAGAPEKEAKPWTPSEAGDPLVSDADRDFWSFKPPRKHAPPEPRANERVRNPIDAFVLARLETAGLSLSPEAERGVLIRRAYYDLVGLPPTPEEAHAHLNDSNPDWYESMIDALLDSPRYGERWARYWLDVAGYADSEGKNAQDVERPFAWRYRDYVIRSFNDDKPYDQFLVEQLAGDELADYENAPELTQELQDNLVATAFLRLGPDGTWTRDSNLVPERLDVISNAFEVLGSAVMGLTLNCARCHSHKYDPLPQRDYYRLRDIFKGALDEHNWMRPALVEDVPFGAHRFPPRYLKVKAGEEFEQWRASQVGVAELEDEVVAMEKRLQKEAQEKEIAKHPEELQRKLRKFLETPPEEYDDEQRVLAMEFEFKLRPPRGLLLINAEFRRLVKELERKKKPQPMIAALWDRGDPSPTYIYRRGEYDKPTELVAPGPPSMLTDGKTPFEYEPPWPGAKSTGRRLAFARWLTQPDHPLTARVMVNRVWKHYFGQGIVPTLHNFGKSGAPPSHPELLDWLACEFVEHGWSIKHLHRLIVCSSVYRQSSDISEDRLRLDPENILLSRMPLVRLDAEQLHDALLSVAGALDLTPYGPGDKVEKLPDGTVASSGGRRAIYVTQKRYELPTLLTAYDLPRMSPNCVSRTVSTVAPQALTLLNGRHVQELASRMATRVALEAGEDPRRRIERVYWLALSRAPTSEELTLGLETLKALADEWWRAPITDVELMPAERALQSYCHAIMNSAAFIYVE